MRLGLVIRTEGPAPKAEGEESLAQGLYLFSAGHPARRVRP
jgi:hypothetical protein